MSEGGFSQKCSNIDVVVVIVVVVECGNEKG